MTLSAMLSIRDSALGVIEFDEIVSWIEKRQIRIGDK